MELESNNISKCRRLVLRKIIIHLDRIIGPPFDLGACIDEGLSSSGVDVRAINKVFINLGI